MSTIENGLRADVMRNKMESKDALQNPGDIYIGTGETTEITVGDKIYKIPKTIGKNLKDAILEFGQIDSYPLSDALKPISISSKDDLVNTDTTLTELAKKSFSYTVSSAPVKLQDADGDKEEVIIPAWSKGMVLSSGNDLLVTYGDGNISGSFFYDQSKPKWTTVKANIASILDAETMKTTNDGLIPKTTESVNLGSKDNCFNTIYAKGIEAYRGHEVNFNHDATDHISFGYRGSSLPIDTYLFLNGQYADSMEKNYAWIASKGFVPYKNNEVNFNVETGEIASIEFGYQGSTAKIDSYIFNNGQEGGGRSAIKCREVEYNSYYNPTGAPLSDPTPQDISENIKSINQRLYDLGFKRASLVINGRYIGEDSIAGRVERWGNVVILEQNWSSADELYIQKIKEEDSDVSFFKSVSPSASALGESIGTIQVATLSSTGVAQIYFYNTYFKQTVIGTNAVVGTGTKFAYKAEPLK